MPVNPYEEQARRDKAEAIYAVLRRALRGGTIDPGLLDHLTPLDWQRAAQVAGHRPPSEETIAMVKDLAAISQGTKSS